MRRGDHSLGHQCGVKIASELGLGGLSDAPIPQVESIWQTLPVVFGLRFGMALRRTA